MTECIYWNKGATPDPGFHVDKVVALDLSVFENAFDVLALCTLTVLSVKNQFSNCGHIIVHYKYMIGSNKALSEIKSVPNKHQNKVQKKSLICKTFNISWQYELKLSQASLRHKQHLQ